jgi:polyphosphate glucokinase
MEVLGIDIGGSGIKGALVDVTTGQLTTDRLRVPTPQPATPQAVLEVIYDITRQLNWQGLIGCGYPGVVKDGVTHTASNMDNAWIGYPLKHTLESMSDCRVQAVNDADAAGIAEMYFGAGRGQGGLVMMITLGTGIGTAAFINGTLIPNLELGHIEIRGEDAELRAAEAAREREDLGWKKWAKRVDYYLHRLSLLLWPDLFIIGGGVSKDWEKFAPHFEKVTVPIVPAQLRNNAGIIGAAMAAVYEHDSPHPSQKN